MSNTELKFIGNSNEWINWIDESIVKEQIKYYDYKYFNNIQEIGSEIGKVYRANWKNSNDYLTLKSFFKFDITVKEIVNELKLQREVDFHENIIHFYGITTENQSDNSKKYLLVMEYTDSGTLRNYLSERFENLTWNDKLNLAFQLTDTISYLHDKEIMHHDLNSNNILVHKNTIKLADFGLSKRIKKLLNLNLFEMVAYIDPQIFNSKDNSNNQIQVYSLNKKSDIYSIGVLLWEISSGRPPFYNKPDDVDLATEILQGLRESPVPNTPKDYVKIYTGKIQLNLIMINYNNNYYLQIYFINLDCWNNKPDDRPNINKVVTKLNVIISNVEDIQLSSELLKSNIEVSENIINGKISQIIQNFNKINVKEIKPSISSNLITNDFELMVIEMILLLENIVIERKKYEIIIYLNNHNITTREIYNWLLNDQDNSNSIFLLGVFNHFGIEININNQKAFELYQNAANLGNVFGITSLGYCYNKGVGTNIDEQKAFEMYQKAANLGNPRGMNNLGTCYINGLGSIIDNHKAFKLYEEAASLGNILGISNLGYCYENGIGTNINEQKAFEYYQEAANLGDNEAQYYLALMYENGEVVKMDINQAIYWYNKCAEQGDLDAQIKLNELLLDL
ncbi:kinase-like domain-containing protein [Rhizophagus diaphanus]|nr:kinase-like domain-containing protein [Rhizophagus diaphanus] [Rhizophagus sp. MUCL 43196]